MRHLRGGGGGNGGGKWCGGGGEGKEEGRKRIRVFILGEGEACMWGD